MLAGERVILLAGKDEQYVNSGLCLKRTGKLLWAFFHFWSLQLVRTFTGKKDVCFSIHHELVDTPMVKKSKLDEDPQGKSVDLTCYHGMIGTLMYIIASRPDLVFAMYMCAQYQAKPTKKHLHALLQMLTMRVAKIPEKVRLEMSQKSLCNSSGILSRRTILDICIRVEGVNFTNVLDDDTTLAFLIKLGYKGPLYKHTNMFMDHMHQPWRTLAAIINKCFSRKITSNDKLRKDYQEHGLSIPETMLTEAIKQSESYQMFIKYSTESKHEPEPIKRQTSSKRRVKKKVTLSVDDNIIFDDPDTALELSKSISKTKAKEAEAARQVHATHLKGVPSLTPEEQEDANIMQALKESKKTSKRQPGTKGSNKGTDIITGVPNESTVVSATSSKGTDKLDEEEKDDKEGDADDEDDETESDEDDIYKYKIHVHKDEDEEMINAEVDDSDKGDEEFTDTVKAYAKKTSKVKDYAKKTRLPPTSSSLSVSSGIGDQFLKLSSDSSLVSTVKDTTDTEINSLLKVKIQSEVPHIQSPSMLRVLGTVISEPLILTPVQESPLKATVTTLPPPYVSTTSSVP
nr:retrovirus-related Pol polyprotein from transposon TNT 1-94 [Tanacetum cinerariifolium]